MASSLMILLVTAVLYVSAAENDNQALCLTLNCGSVNAEMDPTIRDICKKYRCNVRPVAQPMGLQLPPNAYPFYQDPFLFESPPVPQNIDRVTSLDYLMKWPRWHEYLVQKDWENWKNMVARIKNETNIRAKNWLKELENWFKLHKDVQAEFNRVSNLINRNIGAYDDLLEFLAVHAIDVPLFNFVKEHLVFHPQLPQNMPQNLQALHPLNGLFPNLPFQPLPPLLPPNLDQFGFPMPGIPNPVQPGRPGQPGQSGQPGRPGQPTVPIPNPTLCRPAGNNCGSVNVTFDVRVGNITHCSASANEPRQKLKNLLILASHSHKCLTFTTTQRTPNNRSPSGEFLYSVDGITETTQHKWIIYLRSTKKHADLNNYWPSGGDYFVIDYVDGATLQNMKK